MSKATIYYYDIGDYLTREDKLEIIRKFGSLSNVPWKTLSPNEHGDWINKRNSAFEEFIPIGDKTDKANQSTFFVPFYSNGLKTQRDVWCYNSSRAKLRENILVHLDFFNEQRELYHSLPAKGRKPVKDFVDRNPLKISWTRALENDISRNKRLSFDDGMIVEAVYRPFFKQKLYYSRGLNEMVYLIPKLFPDSESENLVICVSGVGVTKPFSAIITDTLPDLELIGKSQCFPLYYYEEREKNNPGLFDEGQKTELIRRDGVSDFILTRAQKQYGRNVTKEDIFYYVYGILQSPEYRTTFANDLKKMLPRLPLVEAVKDFWAFSKAGRKLADLHINYEDVPPYEGVTVSGAEKGFWQVEKMRFPRKGEKKTILYNSAITITNIPEKAYEYVVNGKSAIEWIMERYQIKTDKKSGITNDPNDWAKEAGNPRYILDLLLSVINVSVQTVEIVEELPEVEF